MFLAQSVQQSIAQQASYAEEDKSAISAVEHDARADLQQPAQTAARGWETKLNSAGAGGRMWQVKPTFLHPCFRPHATLPLQCILILLFWVTRRSLCMTVWPVEVTTRRQQPPARSTIESEPCGGHGVNDKPSTEGSDGRWRAC